MSDLPTAEIFQSLAGKKFQPRGWHGSLTLDEVVTRPRQFLVIFRGPRDDVLPEGMYRFDVEGGTELEFYIMPIHTPQPTHQEYQAVFG